jgi:CHAD domain-containing protein
MASRAQSAKAYPVQVLREHRTELEAAIELTMVKPRRKPVHELRTSSRRIEAQLELLGLLEAEEPSLAGVSERATKVRKLLVGVRKAAGKVRDLDVQRDLVRDALDADSTRPMIADAKHLRRKLKGERAEEAAELQKELEGHARKLGPKLEKLLRRLEPAMGLGVSANRLEKLVRGWYGKQTEGAGDSHDELHGIRKAAKLARYMAESGDAAATAQEFENVQQMGGAWHDSLTLRVVAHDELGKRSKLVAVFARHEEATLKDFRATLGLAAEG